MDKNSKVYLSGPISGTADFKKRFKDAQRDLWNMGIAWVVNPAEVISHMPHGMPYKDIMDMCYVMESKCDTVYLLKGWRGSNGCRLEEAYARAHGMKIEEETE